MSGFEHAGMRKICQRAGQIPLREKSQHPGRSGKLAQVGGSPATAPYSLSDFGFTALNLGCKMRIIVFSYRIILRHE